MKFRTGFVSNSSSASFVINRYYVSQYALDKICNHEEVAGKDEWNVKVYVDTIECDTSLDNFDLIEYVKKLGVLEEAIKDV